VQSLSSPTTLGPMSSWSRLAAAFLAALLAAACVTPGTPGVRAIWVTEAGLEADPVALAAASGECEREIGPVISSTTGYDHTDWGVKMIECLEAKGFWLVQFHGTP
jgi:hypothetical protein